MGTSLMQRLPVVGFGGALNIIWFLNYATSIPTMRTSGAIVIVLGYFIK